MLKFVVDFLFNLIRIFNEIIATLHTLHGDLEDYVYFEDFFEVFGGEQTINRI